MSLQSLSVLLVLDFFLLLFFFEVLSLVLNPTIAPSLFWPNIWRQLCHLVQVTYSWDLGRLHRSAGAFQMGEKPSPPSVHPE